mmetsp:Transcript_68692/g.212455  ORF Transcript_68692/g.212455 Transcript_68692/m.212455 type:complete len:271 (-) Transcript_68692:35-847(-)
MGKIRFEVECHTEWGQSVAVCGSGHLGDWDVGRCLVLEPTAYPIWSGEVAADQPSVEYKYVLVQSSPKGDVPQLLGWESAGPNRKIELQNFCRLVLNETFGRLEEQARRSLVEAKAAGDRIYKPAAWLLEREVMYFSAEELAARLGDPDVQVVDVRDVDFAGGHIVGARHCPSDGFHLVLPELARELAMEEKTVVFHCMYSRSRGPRCARLFLQHLEQHFPRWQCAVYVLAGGYDRWELLYASDPDMERYIADRPVEPEYGPKNFFVAKT